MATKTLTKAQWKQFEEDIWDIKFPKLLIDGHKVSVKYAIDRKRMKVVFEVYVDGYIKGEWYNSDSKIGKKFWAETKRYPMLKIARSTEKSIGKRSAKRIGWSVSDAKEKPVVIRQPHFSSFRTMKTTWERNNDSIELYHENKES